MPLPVADTRRSLRACRRPAALLLSLGLIPSAPSLALSLFPTLTCVAPSADGNYITAEFGYMNKDATAADLPVGAENRFTSDAPDQGQPTHFATGTHTSVFKATFDLRRTSTLTWRLNGQQVTAAANRTLCPPVSCRCAPGPEGQQGAQGATGPQGVVGTQGPTGGAGPAGAVGPAGRSALSACRWVSAGTNDGASALAACGSGEQVISGGGACSNSPPLDPAVWTTGHLKVSRAEGGGGWRSECRVGHASAYALCCSDPGSQP